MSDKLECLGTGEMVIDENMRSIIKQAEDMTDRIELLISKLTEEEKENGILKEVKYQIKSVNDRRNKYTEKILESDWISLRMAYNFLKVVDKMIANEICIN